MLATLALILATLAHDSMPHSHESPPKQPHAHEERYEE